MAIDLIRVNLIRQRGGALSRRYSALLAAADASAHGSSAQRESQHSNS